MNGRAEGVSSPAICSVLLQKSEREHYYFCYFIKHIIKYSVLCVCVYVLQHCNRNKSRALFYTEVVTGPDMGLLVLLMNTLKKFSS